MKEIKSYKITTFCDDRGFVSFHDEKLDFSDIKRFYVVQNHQQNFVRAWHGHKNEGKYVYVVSGSVQLCVVPLEADNDYRPMKMFLSDKDNCIVFIPPGYYNGFMTLEKDTKVMFFSTLTTKESRLDDIRQPHDKWNCWEIVPR